MKNDTSEIAEMHKREVKLQLAPVALHMTIVDFYKYTYLKLHNTIGITWCFRLQSETPATKASVQ